MAAMVSIEDLVAIGDHLVLVPAKPTRRDPRPYCTLAELEARAEAFHGRGARLAGAAIGQVRVGAESRTESHLRLLIIDGGLPEPRVNPDIVDRRGMFLARADFAYPEWMTIVEYDGDHHRSDKTQYERDILRVEALERAGWTVVRVRASGLYGDPDGTVARVAAALTRNGWRPPRAHRRSRSAAHSTLRK